MKVSLDPTLYLPRTTENSPFGFNLGGCRGTDPPDAQGTPAFEVEQRRRGTCHVRFKIIENHVIFRSRDIFTQNVIIISTNVTMILDFCLTQKGVMLLK